MAGIAMLLAHGLFKATAVPHRRRRRPRHRHARRAGAVRAVGRALPGLAVAAALAAASMAGLPPLLGFVGKEAAFEAFLHEGGSRTGLVAVGLLAGSVLTVAYSARFLWGAFARKPGRGRRPPVHRPRARADRRRSWLCAAARARARDRDADRRRRGGELRRRATAATAGYHLALWHGLGLPLLFSASPSAGGLALHARARPAGARSPTAAPLDAQRALRERRSPASAGSPSASPGGCRSARCPPTSSHDPGGVRAAARGGHGPRGCVAARPRRSTTRWSRYRSRSCVVVAALAVTRARRRFTAVLLVGVIGYGVGGLFIVDGAPDLALAQFLVETLSLVAFVFVLRRLPAHFTETRPPRRVRSAQGAARRRRRASRWPSSRSCCPRPARSRPPRAPSSPGWLPRARRRPT